MSLVEYHDPDGVFPLILPELQAHLPLKNLHWKSGSRPLRSINLLHVDLVPCQDSAQRGRDGTSQVRRHQLPGLQSTPYLKIYLLRCDENETYKNSSRKAISEWLSHNVPASQSSASIAKPDNHDAFEWLILHIVVPGTAAATQPRHRSEITDSEAPRDKNSGGPKWPGRSPRPILQKLKADFNQSSKSAPDRVAQVRLAKDALPTEFMPARPSTASGANRETSHEHESAWNDLIAKLKAQILKSFTLRVDQYEDDIKERDAQRQLPGWNFNTFFVLKEGLIRAFESVGLLEDALAGYEELSAGLDAFIADQGVAGQASTLLPFTPDHSDLLKSLVLHDSAFDNQTKALSLGRPLSPENKSYRELIVSNNISIFDFQCFIYSRKLQLLSRLAKPGSSADAGRSSTESKSVSSEGRSALEIGNSDGFSELCSSALENVSRLARLLRQDFWTW